MNRCFLLSMILALLSFVQGTLSAQPQVSTAENPKWYYITSCGSGTTYPQVAGKVVFAPAPNQTCRWAEKNGGANQLWRFEASGGGYKMINASLPSLALATSLSCTTSGATWSFSALGGDPTQFKISSGGTIFHAQSDGLIVSWDGGLNSASAWKFEEFSTLDAYTGYIGRVENALKNVKPGSGFGEAPQDALDELMALKEKIKADYEDGTFLNNTASYEVAIETFYKSVNNNLISTAENPRWFFIKSTYTNGYSQGQSIYATTKGDGLQWGPASSYKNFLFRFEDAGSGKVRIINRLLGLPVEANGSKISCNDLRATTFEVKSLPGDLNGQQFSITSDNGMILHAEASSNVVHWAGGYDSPSSWTFVSFLDEANLKDDFLKLPIMGEAGNENYYFIQFAYGNFVIQDMGSGSPILTKEPRMNVDGQLWRIVEFDAANKTYKLKSKLGNFLSFSTSTSRFTTDGSGVKIKLKSTLMQGFEPALMINRDGSSSYMNPNGGNKIDVQLGEYGASYVNLVNFRLPNEIPLRQEATEVALSGTSTAPASKWTVWFRKPAKVWHSEAVPVGNGQFGGMVFGGVKLDEIQFNDKTLWTGTNGKQGGSNYGEYQNFGSVFVETTNVTAASDYRRELRLSDGVASVNYKSGGVNFTREYFSSYPDEALVARYAASENGKISLRIYLWDAHNCVAEHKDDHSFEIKGKFATLSYFAKLKVVNEGGTIDFDGSHIVVENADAVSLILRGNTDYDPLSPTYTKDTESLPATVRAIVDQAAQKDYSTLKSRHLADFKPLFDRFSFEIEDAITLKPTDELVKSYKGAGLSTDRQLEQLQVQMGRYMTISANRGLSLPANLQGIWNNSNTPAWHCDIHTNLNVQMAYWPSEVTNLSEMHHTFLDYIYNQAIVQPQWKGNAYDAKKSIHQELYGSSDTVSVANARGWALYTENNIFGSGGGFGTHDLSANAWLCMHLWQHYQYTLDEEYLEHKALPVMKSACEFWIDRLIADRGKQKDLSKFISKDYAPDGTLVAPLGYSPENGPIEDAVCYNQQQVYMLMRNTIKAVELLDLTEVGVYKEFYVSLCKTFEKMDNGLHIGDDGLLREWKYSDAGAGEGQHCVISQLIGMYPGDMIGPRINKPIFDAAVKRIEQRGEATYGWGLSTRAAYWARALNGEKAYRFINLSLNPVAIKVAPGIFTNLFSAHDGSSTFEADNNYGFPAAVSEMVIQSYTDTIYLLPALPQAWPNGRVKGLKTLSNFEVDLTWNQRKPTRLSILSNKGKACKVAYPLINEVEIKDQTGAVVTPTFSSQDVVVFNTTAGGVYTFEFSNATDDDLVHAERGCKVVVQDDKLHVVSDNTVSRVEIISVATGQKVSEHASSLIDIQPLNTGMYIAKVTDNEGKITRHKFINR